MRWHLKLPNVRHPPLSLQKPGYIVDTVHMFPRPSLSRRPLLVGASFLLAGILIIGAPSSRVDGASTDKPTLLGLATTDFRTELPAFETAAGRSPAIHQLYWPVELDWNGADSVWPAGMLTELKDLGLIA